MEMLVHKCTACQASLKFGKDKAGKKTKCPKCGAEFLLPGAENNKPAAAVPDNDEDGLGYQVALTDDEADKKLRDEAQAKKLTKKASMRIKVRRKNIGDLDVWQKVHTGLLFIMLGAYAWGAAYALQSLVVFMGMVQGPEIGPNAVNFLMPDGQRAPVEPGAAPAMNRAMFFVSLVGGSDFAPTCRVLLIIGQVLTFIQIVLWTIGYGMCLPIENRLGTRGQLITLFSFAGANLLLNLFLRFLPLIGVLGYVLAPYFAPELVMSEVNTERTAPMHTVWCRLPTLEITLAILVYAVNLLEPVLIGVFLWTIAQIVRDEPLEERALGSVKLGLSICFIIATYQMYSCAGTSSVLVKLTRAIYTLWFAFQVLYIVKLAACCAAARDTIKFYLKPEE